MLRSLRQIPKPFEQIFPSDGPRGRDCKPNDHLGQSRSARNRRHASLRLEACVHNPSKLHA